MFPATTNIKVENQMGNFSIGKTCHIASGGFAIENIVIPHTGKEKKYKKNIMQRTRLAVIILKKNVQTVHHNTASFPSQPSQN
jgi:hypothetical protein